MKKIRLRLSRRERDLLSQYGYPFDGIRRQLKQHEKAAGPATIADDSFWWEQVVGQLSISVNEDLAPNDHPDYSEVNDLADRIENALGPDSL